MDIRKAEELFSYELGIKYLKDRDKERDFYFKPFRYDIPIRNYKDEFLELLKKDFKMSIKYHDKIYPSRINKELEDMKNYCMYDTQDWINFLVENNELIKTA